MTAGPIRLTVAAARALHLAAQGLSRPPKRAAREADVLAAIQRMCLLQIDTIHVVARSPYLVLFSRLGAYPPQWLDDLLARGGIFETWAHEACFAPMADYALLRAHLVGKEHHWAMRNAVRLRDEQSRGMLAMLEHIRSNGAVRSSDFQRTDGAASGGWWGWKDEKRWLEAWFGVGELMVARRERFQRVYDLTERVLANAGVSIDMASGVSDDGMRAVLIDRTVRALGIARAGWIADYYRLRPRVSDGEMQALVDAGIVHVVQVSGWAMPAYVHADLLPMARLAAAGRLRSTTTALLSPFDPVVWDRARASELFGFDYRLECYVPESKRRHGYFVLPILHRGRLVGRLDAKAHRQARMFEVKMIELETDVVVSERLTDAIAAAIARFANWHGAERLAWQTVRPRGLAAPLKRQSALVLTSLVAD